MKISRLALFAGAGWTIGAFGAGQLLRLTTNVALARLLAPELFGIMVIINSVRTGIDLISDLGIGQNIVHNRNADNPEFYNTAWSLQLLRGFLLWMVAIAAADPLAQLYGTPTILMVLPVAALYFVFGGAASVGLFLAQRQMRLRRLNAFEFLVECFSSFIHIVLSYLNPTIWALVIGGIATAAFKSIGSYFLLPQLRLLFFVSRAYFRDIVFFGKWVFISSIAYFLSMNFDRLYLGKVMTFEILGVYGIARTLSDLLAALVARLGNMVIFPLVAASDGTPRTELRRQLAPMRLLLLLAVGLGISLMAVTADVLIRVLYDARYQQAGWMLPLLAAGVWFAILASINESVLLGFGKPQYGTVANGMKFAGLLVGLPLGFVEYGVLGAVCAVALSDLGRYLPTFVGLVRERFSFGMQDLLATLVVFGLIAVWGWARWVLGFGTSLDGLLMPRPL